MKRGTWITLLLGMAAGLLLGLYYSWILNPLEYVETSPNTLREDFKADYLALIASAYTGTGDISRARARLSLFPQLNPEQDLAALAQKRLASGWPDSEARALAQLASDLRNGPRTPTLIPTLTSTRSTASNGFTASPSPTSTPRPSATPVATSTPGAPFQLVHREQLCDPNLTSPQIQVEVFDASGNPVPGVEVIVIWDQGEDHFYTGLKPELGLGFADFTMTSGVTYALQLAEANQPVTDLGPSTCTEDGETYPGSWRLRFEQPPQGESP